MNYLLDSVILIDHFNAIEPATDFLAEHGTECALSTITRAEVLAGFNVEQEPLARELLDIFPCLPLNAETADVAARLRRSERWKLPDAFQAAVAMQHGLTLVTRNSRDFQPGGEPAVFIPYRL
ncbi:MAG: PIN domain-containing protein [Gammaproteobacteria bacterium]